MFTKFEYWSFRDPPAFKEREARSRPGGIAG